MCTDRKGLKQAMQVELVDNWHPRWGEVLDAIEHVGQRSSLQIDADGWLSARHNLLVAFVDDTVAGHLSFRVQPVELSAESPQSEASRPVVEAQLESLSVQPGFESRLVESMLRSMAEKRAQALRCQRLIDA